eukprot:TRINITY_DN2269_c0_g3_i5.p1 TRINITY_DN2269_c0_g3~~TRINITY_DN2269_c0_g3_i5.p1  ORF type:complete len:224 (-),score=35.22 TRINITY_DN2269_c0_g3_i5:1203-1874(-)
MCIDPEGREFPVAFGIVGNEDTRSWKWFFARLKEALGEGFFSEFGMMSDQQKGLLAAQEKVFPGMHTLRCALHIIGNLKKTFHNKDVVKAFNRIRLALSQEEYDSHFNSVDKAVQDYLDGLLPETWALAYITCRNYGHTTSNLVESYNASLKEVREKNIIGALNKLIENLTRWFYERCPGATEAADEEVLPGIQSDIEVLCSEAARYTVNPISGNEGMGSPSA